MDIFSIIPKSELSLRWEKLQAKMVANNIDSLIVSDNTSLHYLSGRIFAGVVYVCTDREPLFFVRRPIGLTGENVVYIRKVEDIPAAIAERGYPAPKNIAYEGDFLTYHEYMRLQKIFGLESENIFSNATSIIRGSRSVKTPYEIEQIRLSGLKHAQLYSQVTSTFKRGMSDNDLAIELEYQARKLGSVGSMRIFGHSMEVFIGSILTGDNASAPSPYDFALGGEGLNSSLPVGCNGTVIEDGMVVMVDQGGNFGSYMTDMTRVFSLGKVNDLAYRAHQTALEMQQTMCEMAKPGTATADVYNMCIEIAKRESIAEYFMGKSQQAGFVGHGVGLEVNELPVLAPRSRDLFEEGNVFAFEPKFTLPAIGAVGIENTFAVTNSGVEKLTIFEENIISLD